MNAAEQYDLIIRDCSLIDEAFMVQTHRDIAISGGKIVKLGETPIPGHSHTVLDGREKLFLPGLTDAHTHVCQQLLRGRILDQLPMIWTRIMLPFESTLTEEAVEISAQLACLEMIKSGTTAFADAGGRFMDKVAETVAGAGIRAALTCSTIDQGDCPPTMKLTADEALRRNNEFYNAWHGAGDGRVSVFFSVRSMLSCSEDLTVRVFETARKLGTQVHAHVSEYPNEVNSCLERFRKRPVEHLDELGLLGPDFLAAHSILVSDDEIDLMASKGVKVVHCPFSNCGKGVPPTPRLLQRGVSVGLGTDGTAHGGLSLWSEMKIFRSVMNAHVGAPAANPVIMPAKTLLEMATRGGAAALGRSGDLGVVREGYRADLISIRLDQPHVTPSSNLVNTLVESVNAGDVADMVVDGKQVMRDRQVLTMDETQILSRARALHSKLFADT